MRTLTLAAFLVSLPLVASAQVYYSPPPPPMGAVPPHVYIQQRVRWHHWRHVVPSPVVVVQGAPPTWVAPVAPSPPPPPVYVAPPPPVYIEPQQPIYVQPQPTYAPPIYAPPPVYYAQPQPVPSVTLVRETPKPQWQSKFGFGATVEGAFSMGDMQATGAGIMGQLRYRAARHLSLEVMGGYERATTSTQQALTNVPITGGLLIHILGPEHMFSPYLVGAAGLNFANLRLLDAPTLKIEDSRTQFVGQLGAGLEMRLGQHFAINADARLEGRWNLNEASDAVKATTSIDGKAVKPIEDSVAFRLGLGASLYF